ncbi:CHAT domain-containing tetratricopeptide repeat protein [Dactylosporangium sp. NPDC049742]|uniref:CHAT domain-containing protein n=1 Tax=Dactylosporangium sp. NPDC049742 TaxID=3154737 RepID=UPI00341ECA40
MDGRVVEVRAAFEQCGAYFRDTTLARGVLEMNRPGILLREPTYCDASRLPGGFVAPHRYLIFSANARTLGGDTPDDWGLRLWPRGRIFKVIDRIIDQQRAQITLLEIPEHLVNLFLDMQPNGIELTYVQHGRDLFYELHNAPPVAGLDSDAWRDRLVYPVGIDDAHKYFPMYGPDAYANDETEPTIARVAQHLASVHMRANATAEAEAVLRPAIEGLQSAAHRMPEDFAHLLVTRADLRVQIADYRGAESDLHEAFRLCQQLGQGGRLQVAVILTRLGHLYQAMGSSVAAERFYQHALQIRRSASGERSAPQIPILVSLGALHERTNRLDTAGAYLLEALAIAHEHDKPDDPTLLNNLSRVHHANGQLDDALRTAEAALAAIEPEDIEGTQRATLLANLAEIHAAQGSHEAALRLLVEVLHSQRKLIEQVRSFGSHEQRLLLLQAARSRLNQYVSLILARFADSPARLLDLANAVVERKGMGVDAFARERAAVHAGDHPLLREHLEELRIRRSFIADQRLSGPDYANPDQFQETLRTATKQLEALELELTRSLPNLDDHGAVDCVTIARSIPPDTTAVEFQRFRPFNYDAIRAHGEKPWGADRYVAIVLTPAHPNQPTVVDLGDADAIDVDVAALRAQIASTSGLPSQPGGTHLTHPTGYEDIATHLYDVLIVPLLSAIGDVRHLVLAPDGDLCRLPFGVLRTADGRLLIDDYTISYLTATRDLLRLANPPRSQGGPPVVVATPDFNLGGTPLCHKPYSRLPGARMEGIEVAQYLGIAPVLGSEATKAAVQQAHSPSILHIATHGFFEDREPPLEPGDLKVGMTFRFIDHDRESIVLDGILATPVELISTGDSEFGRRRGRHLDNPLLRSGLAFAGANTWSNDGDPPHGNGLLTAFEVAELDLQGTQLVVLSACDTGLGEIESGEGVFGLQRAFHLAGARTLVMSLWKVPDESTKELMAHMYRLLAAGATRADALREAQRLVRVHHPNPLDWAAFICQGDPGRLPKPPAGSVPAAPSL